MSRLVTNSPTSGADDRQPRASSLRLDAAPEPEQLFIFGRAEAVEHHGDAAAGVSRPFANQPFDQDARERARRHDRLLGDARLAMNAEADRHLTIGNDEQRLAGARQRAAAKGDAEGDGAAVGDPRQPLHIVERHAGLRGRAGDLEDDDVARDAPAQRGAFGGRAGDIVGDRQDARVDALGGQTPRRRAEVEHVAGVIAEAEQHPAAAIGQPGDPRDRARRGRGENVAGDSGVGETGADIARESGIVTGAAADDDRHFAGRRRRGAQNASRRERHIAAIGRGETAKGFSSEALGLVVHKRHDGLSAALCSPPSLASPHHSANAAVTFSTMPM